jgi:hypothetical protein
VASVWGELAGKDTASISAGGREMSRCMLVGLVPSSLLMISLLETLASRSQQKYTSISSVLVNCFSASCPNSSLYDVSMCRDIHTNLSSLDAAP